MNINVNKMGWIALLVWLASVSLFAWFFVRGSTAPGTDSRTAIVLAPAERVLMLTEMRGFLAGVQGILDGINHNDMKRVAGAARAIGEEAAEDINPALMAKLPLPFKQLGMSVHHDMDDLAHAAETGKTAAELQSMLANTLSKCVSCHAAWQLKPGE